MNLLNQIQTAVEKYPEVLPHLSGRARFIAFAKGGEYKSYDFFLTTLGRMVTNVYMGNLGGEFIDIMANLIQGQITRAYESAWVDEGFDPPMPDYLTASANRMIVSQYAYVDQYYRDIVDARIDKTPLEPLLKRAELWANRYNEAYNNAIALITKQNGGKLKWVEGDTKDKCKTCVALNGIVAYASIWTKLNVHPQGGDNPKLECRGWGCGCKLLPTTERQTRGAEKIILSVIISNNKHYGSGPHPGTGSPQSAHAGNGDVMGSPAKLSPYLINPVNEITDIEKYNRLVSDMRDNGWRGLPILAYEGPHGMQAVTGSHRILAAREAGIEIPVSILEFKRGGIDYDIFETDMNAFLEASRDEDILSVFDDYEFVKKGYITKDQYDIFKKEVKNNR